MGLPQQARLLRSTTRAVKPLTSLMVVGSADSARTTTSRVALAATGATRPSLNRTRTASPSTCLRARMRQPIAPPMKTSWLKVLARVMTNKRAKDSALRRLSIRSASRVRIRSLTRALSNSTLRSSAQEELITAVLSSSSPAISLIKSQVILRPCPTKRPSQSASETGSALTATTSTSASVMSATAAIFTGSTWARLS